MPSKKFLRKLLVFGIIIYFNCNKKCDAAELFSTPGIEIQSYVLDHNGRDANSNSSKSKLKQLSLIVTFLPICS